MIVGEVLQSTEVLARQISVTPMLSVTTSLVPEVSLYKIATQLILSDVQLVCLCLLLEHFAILLGIL